MDETFRSRQDSHEADLKDIYDIDWAHDASLLIANLTPQVQENHLSEIVGCYGDVENIRLKRAKNKVYYAVVTMTSAMASEKAQKALHRGQIDGQVIQVCLLSDPATVRSLFGSTRKNGVNSRLFVNHRYAENNRVMRREGDMKPYNGRTYGRKDYGRSDYGRNEYGRNEYGRNEYRRNEYGRNEYGRNAYGRTDQGRSEHARDDYPRNDYGRNDYGRHDYGRNDYGRNDNGRNDYERNGRRRDDQGRDDTRRNDYSRRPDPRETLRPQMKDRLPYHDEMERNDYRKGGRLDSHTRSRSPPRQRSRSPKRGADHYRARRESSPARGTYRGRSPIREASPPRSRSNRRDASMSSTSSAGSTRPIKRRTRKSTRDDLAVDERRQSQSESDMGEKDARHEDKRPLRRGLRVDGSRPGRLPRRRSVSSGSSRAASPERSR